MSLSAKLKPGFGTVLSEFGFSHAEIESAWVEVVHGKIFSEFECRPRPDGVVVNIFVTVGGLRLQVFRSTDVSFKAIRYVWLPYLSVCDQNRFALLAFAYDAMPGFRNTVGE